MNRAERRTATTELTWLKSSHSGAEGGDCVEVTATADAVLIRDSKQPAAARLAVGADAWSGFVRMAAGH
ncbi:DUF397 domain-containing protein [Streptomyces hirsutus]|uniref:DUF397 domain-containing protein n=1 Tax=Streptomyces hirsutus TaxID=35620 RepID=UPI0036A5E4AC